MAIPHLDVLSVFRRSEILHLHFGGLPVIQELAQPGVNWSVLSILYQAWVTDRNNEWIHGSQCHAEDAKAKHDKRRAGRSFHGRGPLE